MVSFLAFDMGELRRIRNKNKLGRFQNDFLDTDSFEVTFSRKLASLEVIHKSAPPHTHTLNFGFLIG